MNLGAMTPSIYDDECTTAQESTGGNVALIVIDGKRGSGFAVQATLPVIASLPAILRSIADEIDAGRH